MILALAAAHVMLDAASGRILSQAGAVLERASPGSAMKPFVVLAAGGHQPLACQRKVRVGGRVFDCAHPPANIAFGPAEALAYSCNFYFANLAKRLDTGRLRELGLPVEREPVTDEERTLMALGDFGVRISALELARAYLRAAPRLGSLLRGAVEYGTAQRAGVPGLDVAGKTGTSKGHAWFAGFAPGADPRVVVVVRAPEGTGGATAAPEAAKLLLGWARIQSNWLVVSGRVVDREDYVASVVAGEAGIFSHVEALKAMAVLARTYAAVNRGGSRHKAEGWDLCDAPHCQRIQPRGVDARVRASVVTTAGEMVWWQGSPAQVFYHRHCGGVTESAENVWPGMRAPYLKEQQDNFCLARGRAQWEKSIDAHEVSVQRRSHSGRVTSLRWDGQTVSFDGFRNVVDSAWFEVSPRAPGKFALRGIGSGHGVGVCQTGANERAAAGHGYREILSFYLPGTKAGITPQGLSWRTESGERAELITTQPERDRAVLTSAERALKAVEQRLGRRAAGPVRIRMYPTPESFREATGEPAWVMASALENTIRLHPAALQRGIDDTLLHECVHVVLRSGRLPRWYDEGLADYLVSATRPPRTASRMRDWQRVRSLTAQFGEAAVFTWAARGELPPEAATRSTQNVTTSR